MKLIVLVGPCGSGKSSWAKEYKANHTEDVPYFGYINQDTQGKDGHFALFINGIEQRESMIIDRMNFDKKQRDRYIKPAKAAGYEIEIVVFHVPRSVCFARMMARKDHATINGKTTIEGGMGTSVVRFCDTEKAKQANSALDTFFTKYERVEDSEADKVTRLGHDEIRKKAIICDLDGTLCNIDHRLHHVKHEIKKHNRWDLFNKAIPNDTLNTWCAGIIGRIGSDVYSIKLDIVLCSGRVDSTRKDTEEWLNNHYIRYEHLFMRHRADFRQDYIIKEIILDFEILTRYDPFFFIDDRQQVVDMYRRRGFVVLQCAPGNF